jgi:signal transduction histidine kinase
MPDGQVTERITGARSPPRKGGLLAKFLLILTPVFLLLAIPGIGFLVHFELRADREALAARVGNQAARVAAALGRHLKHADATLVRDLLAPLAADRAFICAEFIGLGGAMKAQWPPQQGCKGVTAGEMLVLPVANEEQSELRIRFSDTELRAAQRFQVSLALSVVGIAFLIALLASVIGFRAIVGKPLRLLLDAIRLSSETGERRPVAWRGRDELGDVIAEFDELVRRENGHEIALNAANAAMLAARRETEALNAELEERVAERTAELETAMHAAEKAADSKTRFLWTMSHELRTPLNAIIGFSEMIRDASLGPLGNPLYGEFAGDISVAGQKLLGAINAVLDIGRIESGDETLKEDTVELGPMLEKCARAAAEAAGECKVHLAIDLPREIWLCADPPKLRRAIGNLMANAVNFSESGGTVTLAATMDATGDVAVTVADTGCGMAPEQIPAALATFGRLDDSLTRESEGLGLGLALARLIAELHGGGLTLESAPGVGTTATLHLPSDRLRPAERRVNVA